MLSGRVDGLIAHGEWASPELAGGGEAVESVFGRVVVADEDVDAEQGAGDAGLAEELDGAGELAFGAGVIPGEADSAKMTLGDAAGVVFGE